MKTKPMSISGSFAFLAMVTGIYSTNNLSGQVIETKPSIRIMQVRDALKVQPLNISGAWNSNVGLIYEVEQKEGMIRWGFPGEVLHNASGTIKGKSVSVRWHDPVAERSGLVQGEIMLDNQGKISQINWSNGVVFYKGTYIQEKPKEVIPITIPSPDHVSVIPITLPYPRPDDVQSFFADVSVNLLAKQLSSGQSLGSPARDSRDFAMHHNWARNADMNRIKMDLLEKLNQMVDIKVREGAEAKSEWYALLCSTWAGYGIDFGSPGANNTDPAVHKRWAWGQPATVLKNEIKTRLDKIFTAYEATTPGDTKSSLPVPIPSPDQVSVIPINIPYLENPDKLST